MRSQCEPSHVHQISNLNSNTRVESTFATHPNPPFCIHTFTCRDPYSPHTHTHHVKVHLLVDMFSLPAAKTSKRDRRKAIYVYICYIFQNCKISRAKRAISDPTQNTHRTLYLITPIVHTLCAANTNYALVFNIFLNQFNTFCWYNICVTLIAYQRGVVCICI